MVKSICAVLCSIAIAASAAPPRDAANYSRVLLPVLTVQSSAGTWMVNWWVRNDGDVAADVFPMSLPCGLPPPDRVVFFAQNPAVPPHANLGCLAGDALPSFVVPAVVPLTTTGAGALLYVDSAHASQLAIRGNVQWLSSTGPGTSAELQAVPEGALLSGTASVLAVPHQQSHRYSLRIYALPETIGDPHVTVAVYEMQPLASSVTETLLSITEADLRIPTSSLPACLAGCDLPNVAYAPAIAQLFDLVPNADPVPSTLRFEITPHSADLRWWALVSATDAKQNVALYTPPFRIRSR